MTPAFCAEQTRARAEKAELERDIARLEVNELRAQLDVARKSVARVSESARAWQAVAEKAEARLAMLDTIPRSSATQPATEGK